MTYSQDERVIEAARDWIGTPYRHQASLKGAGTDCLGLIRGVWRDVIGPEPVSVPPYRAEWAELSGQDTLLEAAQAYLTPVDANTRQPGDILLFRLRNNVPVKHCAILSAPDRMIHAYQGRSVCETAFVPWWQRRLALVARFPQTPL